MLNLLSMTVALLWSLRLNSYNFSTLLKRRKQTMNSGAMTESEYLAALAEIETLMLATLDTDDGQRLDALVCFVQTYEAKHWPL